VPRRAATLNGWGNGSLSCRWVWHKPLSSNAPRSAGHASFSSGTIRRYPTGLHPDRQEPGELLDGKWLGKTELSDPSLGCELGRVSDPIHASHQQSNNPELTPVAPQGCPPPVAGCLRRSSWFPRMLADPTCLPPCDAQINPAQLLRPANSRSPFNTSGFASSFDWPASLNAQTNTSLTVTTPPVSSAVGRMMTRVFSEYIGPGVRANSSAAA